MGAKSSSPTVARPYDKHNKAIGDFEHRLLFFLRVTRDKGIFLRAALAGKKCFVISDYETSII